MSILNLSTTLALAALAASAQTAPPVKKAAPTTAPAPAKPAAAKPAAAKPAVANANDPVVLTIGTETMTKSQYEALIKALPEQARAQANGPNKRKFAEQIAEMKSLAYEARRRKIDQDPEVRAKLALQTDNVLASELFRTTTANLKADDAAIQSYYDQHKAEYEQVHARHVLIRFKGSGVPAKEGQKELTEDEALAKAKAVREQIVKGGDFAEIAKKESDDTGSGAQGGDLSFFGHGAMVKPFEDAAFALPVGQVSEPVKSQFGWHVIKVEEHTTQTKDQVKSQIEGKMKQDLAKKALEDLKASIPVKIDDTYFGKP